jgi:hypothetical protein
MLVSAWAVFTRPDPMTASRSERDLDLLRPGLFETRSNSVRKQRVTTTR